MLVVHEFVWDGERMAAVRAAVAQVAPPVGADTGAYAAPLPPPPS